MTTTHTREIDGLEGRTVAVEIASTYSDEGYGVSVSADANCWPHSSTLITPAAARALAAHLIELADEADVRNA